MAARPTDALLWSWLAEVPDPEIPVISVVDLGIVRGIGWDGDTLVVTVTPTYSGCPATRVIAEDIVAQLRGHGVGAVRVERRLAPPWTTAWLSASGREKLRAYGIAPPLEEAAGGGGGSGRDRSGCALASAAPAADVVRVFRPGDAPPAPAAPPERGTAARTPTRRAGAAGDAAIGCPRCGAVDVERVSQFGSTPCKASYRCRECLEPFDYFKPI